MLFPSRGTFPSSSGSTEGHLLIRDTSACGPLSQRWSPSARPNLPSCAVILPYNLEYFLRIIFIYRPGIPLTVKSSTALSAPSGHTFHLQYLGDLVREMLLHYFTYCFQTWIYFCLPFVLQHFLRVLVSQFLSQSA